MLLEQIETRLKEKLERVQRILGGMKPTHARGVRNVQVGPELHQRLHAFTRAYGFHSARQAMEALLAYALDDAEVLLRGRRQEIEKRAAELQAGAAREPKRPRVYGNAITEAYVEDPHVEDEEEADEG